MRRRNRSPSPQRRIRRSSGADTCCSDRSKYGTPVAQIASLQPVGQVGRVQVQQAHPVDARARPPRRAGRWRARRGLGRARSSPGPARRARSPARRARRPRRGCRRSSASAACPGSVGMAQKPHARSQPSATFTYAHGAAASGRGKVQQVHRRRVRPAAEGHRHRLARSRRLHRPPATLSRARHRSVRPDSP